MCAQAFVYIMANRPNGTIYIGVTAHLAQRVYQHRAGLVQGFTKRYGLTKLVYCEPHVSIAAAIQRERNLKHWPRRWKLALIEGINPQWRDLYEEIHS